MRVVWHIGLTGEQSDGIELVQRRALSIIEPDATNEEALAAVGLESVCARSERQARAFYLKMEDPNHKLHHLLPEPRQLIYGLRQSRKYTGQRLKTDRAKNTLVHYGLSHW